MGFETLDLTFREFMMYFGCGIGDTPLEVSRIEIMRTYFTLHETYVSVMSRVQITLRHQLALGHLAVDLALLALEVVLRHGLQCVGPRSEFREPGFWRVTTQLLRRFVVSESLRKPPGVYGRS